MSSPGQGLRALDEGGFEAACGDLALVVFGVEWSASCAVQISMVTDFHFNNITLKHA